MMSVNMYHSLMCFEVVLYDLPCVSLSKINSFQNFRFHTSFDIFTLYFTWLLLSQCSMSFWRITTLSVVTDESVIVLESTDNMEAIQKMYQNLSTS